MYPDSPEREDFGAELAWVYRSWRAIVDAQLRPLDMTQARWITLLHIARGGTGLLQKDLAERMGIEGPTLVRLLDALETADLVTRKEAPGDRRGKTLALTQRAQPIVDEIERVVSESRQQVLGDISDEDIAACVRVFRHVREKIAAYDGSPDIVEHEAAGAD